MFIVHLQSNRCPLFHRESPFLEIQYFTDPIFKKSSQGTDPSTFVWRGPLLFLHGYSQQNGTDGRCSLCASVGHVKETFLPIKTLKLRKDQKAILRPMFYSPGQGNIGEKTVDRLYHRPQTIRPPTTSWSLSDQL